VISLKVILCLIVLQLAIKNKKWQAVHLQIQSAIRNGIEYFAGLLATFLIYKSQSEQTYL